jgi:hypothetical protein
LVTLLCLPMAAQKEAPDASRDFPKGTVSARLTVNLPSPPDAGDSIDISCSTSDLRVTLLTPDGRRITSETAPAAQLGWFESPSSEPDWGRSVIITFQHPAESGAYSIEVSGQTKRKSKVNIFLSSPSKAHAAVIAKAFPGAIVASSVSAPDTITLSVKEDEQASLIDVLVSDPDTSITLTLPDGRTITPFDGTSLTPTIKPERVASLLFPQSGRHYLFYFDRTPHGAYRVTALPAGEHAEFRALFVPYERVGAPALASRRWNPYETRN